jgi:L-fuculose-phosphate aldolase
MKLSDSLAPYVPDHDAILMANHGVVTYGADLRQAYLRMEAVEHYAKIVLAARQLGTTRTLSETQLAELVVARSRYRQSAH